MSILRDALLIASIELLIHTWGLLFSLSWYPHVLTKRGVMLRWSNLVGCVIPWELIKNAKLRSNHEPSGRIGVIFHPDSPEVFFTNSTNTNMTLTLNRQVVIPAWLTSKKPVDSIHLSLAEPERFIGEVIQRRQLFDDLVPAAKVEVLSGNTESTGLNSRSLTFLTLALEIPLFLIGFAWMQQGIDLSATLGLTVDSIFVGIGLGVVVALFTVFALSWGSKS